MIYKICSKCKQSLLYTQFNPHLNNNRHKKWICNDCVVKVNQIFEKARLDENNIKIVKKASQNYRKYLNKSALNYCYNYALWRSLLYYDDSHRVKFLTYLYSVARCVCMSEIKHNNKKSLFIKTKKSVKAILFGKIPNSQTIYINDQPIVNRSQLDKYIKDLNQRDKDMMVERYIDRDRMHIIAKRHNISKQRVEQILRKCNKSIKKTMEIGV